MDAGDQALSRTDLEGLAEREIGLSEWIVVDQEAIDRFAALSGDDQFIHVDPARTRAETSLPGTIAHGFLILSLLSRMGRGVLPVLGGQRMSLNYGFDRVRFVTPVPAGARIRGRFVLGSAEERAPGEVTLALRVTVEIEGADRPALVADWLSRRYVAPEDIEGQDRS